MWTRKEIIPDFTRWLRSMERFSPYETQVERQELSYTCLACLTEFLGRDPNRVLRVEFL